MQRMTTEADYSSTEKRIPKCTSFSVIVLNVQNFERHYLNQVYTIPILIHHLFLSSWLSYLAFIYLCGNLSQIS